MAGSSGSAGSAGLSGGGGSTGSGNAGSAGTSGLDGGDNLYCPSAEPYPEGTRLCRERDDCGQAMECYSGGRPAVSPCGACIGPTSPCMTDDDCGNGVCEAFADPCSCFAEPAFECRAACTADSCTKGERCAANGHCETMLCNDGWSCTDDERCNPEASRADVHGCEPIACADGWECREGSVCDPDGAGPHDAHGCRILHCQEPGGVTCGDNLDCDASTGGNGCRVRRCTADAECDCGTCVMGGCQSRPGVCDYAAVGAP